MKKQTKPFRTQKELIILSSIFLIIGLPLIYINIFFLKGGILIDLFIGIFAYIVAIIIFKLIKSRKKRIR